MFFGVFYISVNCKEYSLAVSLVARPHTEQKFCLTPPLNKTADLNLWKPVAGGVGTVWALRQKYVISKPDDFWKLKFIKLRKQASYLLFLNGHE